MGGPSIVAPKSHSSRLRLQTWKLQSLKAACQQEEILQESDLPYNAQGAQQSEAFPLEGKATSS